MTEQTEVVVVPRTMTLTINVELSDETITNLIDAAGYGMNDYCRRGIIDEDNQRYTFWPHADVVDGKQVHKKHVVTYDQIGAAIVALWDADALPDWFEQEIRDGEICGDSLVGSNIIQQAAFGEVVFG